jgi:F-type H+-transporting ATPase subunit delta
VQLLDSLLRGKADTVTVELLERTVRSGRKHSMALAVDGLLTEVAWRRQRATALVRSAAPLTDEQITRLAAVLREMYGRDIDIRVVIDPAVTGGLVVRVGDEVIDGSVAGRLAAARSALKYQ